MAEGIVKGQAESMMKAEQDWNPARPVDRPEAMQAAGAPMAVAMQNDEA